MSNRFVYFYRVKKKTQVGNEIREEIVSGIAQLMDPITSHDQLGHLKAMLEMSFPDMAPITAIDGLTFLHREKVADE